MKTADTILHSANILVSTIGVVTADSVLPGAGVLISGKLSITALLRNARPDTDDLDKRVGKLLNSSLNNPNAHMPREADKIIPQMIEAGSLSPGEVMGAARDPSRICAAMLKKLKDPEHRHNDMQQAFTRVVQPIFVGLLDDPGVTRHRYA